jgi:hypothetical protein
MVAQGSIVDVQLTSDTGSGTPDAVIQKAVKVLTSGGQLTSIGPKVTTSFLTGFFNTVTSLSSDQPFQVDFPVVCNSDFNSPEDVASIVANAFYQATSNYPASVSPVSVTPPNSYGTTPALSDSGMAGNDTGAGAAVTSLSGSITSTIQSLGNIGTNLLIGLAAIVVLAIILIAYGPNIGKIASAA